MDPLFVQFTRLKPFFSNLSNPFSHLETYFWFILIKLKDKIFKKLQGKWFKGDELVRVKGSFFPCHPVNGTIKNDSFFSTYAWLAWTSSKVPWIFRIVFCSFWDIKILPQRESISVKWVEYGSVTTHLAYSTISDKQFKKLDIARFSTFFTDSTLDIMLASLWSFWISSRMSRQALTISWRENNSI